jgi:hypothetical protein
MTSRPAGLAVVGCGGISDQYLANLTTFPDVEVASGMTMSTVFKLRLDTAPYGNRRDHRHGGHPRRAGPEWIRRVVIRSSARCR